MGDERGKKRKSCFDELLLNRGTVKGREEDEAVRRMLRRKLGMGKGEKLKDEGDGLDDLLDGLEDSENESDATEQSVDSESDVEGGTSDIDDEEAEDRVEEEGEEEDEEEEEEEEDGEESDSEVEEKEEGVRNVGATTSAQAKKYIPPQQRGISTSASSRITRAVRGLLNRLAEGRVSSTSSSLASLAAEEGRVDVAAAVTAEILGACADGPRATERFLGTAAALVTGMACLVGIEVGARFVEAVARKVEKARETGDSVSGHNFALLIVRLLAVGLLPPQAVYGLLQRLCQVLTELDVMMMADIMKGGGGLLRTKDPKAMKVFVVDIHRRVGEARRSGKLTSKVDVMLGLVLDVKNNKHRGLEIPINSTDMKWLKESNMAKVALDGITWSLLLEEDKRGMWWVPGAVDARRLGETNGKALSKLPSAEIHRDDYLDALAKQHRFTGLRKNIFCVIMGAGDYIDAFERLVRLGLKGPQEREILRVLLECCLREKKYNGYYGHLAAKLCSHNRQMKFTMQLICWDQFNELSTANARRIQNLGKFVASMILDKVFGLIIMKTLELGRAGGKAGARSVLLGRIILTDLLQDTQTNEDIQKLTLPPSAALCQLAPSLIVFMRAHVVQAVAKELKGRLEVLEETLRDASNLGVV